MSVIICGGGVIGACIAYFLSRRGVDVTVVERVSVGHAASGHSGGFLASDWSRGTPSDELARRSFVLHAELAETLKTELDLDWGYRRLDTLSVIASEERDFSQLSNRNSPDWLAPTAATYDRIGTQQTTAHLHPGRFTQAMMAAAQAHGAKLIIGTVDGITLSEASDPDQNDILTGIVVNGEELRGDAAIIALGPWSILACQWLLLPAVYGLKGHSLLFNFTPDDPFVLFAEVETTNGEVGTPEIVPRTDGTTYVCGVSSQQPVPFDPAQVKPDPDALKQLHTMTSAIAPDLGDAQLVSANACFRPITADGLPLIGVVPDVEGAYVATGHSVWGMLNGPATGEAMADLIIDGRSSRVDLAPFDPGRLTAFK